MVIDITALDMITEIVKKEMLLQVNVHIFLIFLLMIREWGILVHHRFKTETWAIPTQPTNSSL